MAYQSKPTVDGVYLISVLSKNLYIESVLGDNPKLQLAPRSSNDNQKWNLTQDPDKPGVWKMTCVEGNAGLTYAIKKKLFWGYGHPYPHSGDSQEWNFIERDQTFSKIKFNDGTDCFDACEPRTNTIHFYSDQRHSTSGPNQCYVFELLPPEEEEEEEPEVEEPEPEKLPKALDVMFLQDFTSSQGPYIERAKSEINQVCSGLLRLSEGELAVENIRFGLVAFRDHPPQDNTFVTRRFDFTSNSSTMASNLGSLSVSGGGDGPEAQCDALHDALHSPWNEGATKVAVLITDAPPHGIGESSDGFPTGCPCGYDPLEIASEMLNAGITLYVVACEPELSTSYQNARHFYEGLTRKTGGQIYNLGNPSGLTDVIIGCLMQESDTDGLIARYRAAIRRDADSGNLSPEEIARRLHEELSSSNVAHYTLNQDDMVEASEEGDRNIQEWFAAANLAAAKGKIRPTAPVRIKSEYAAGMSPASTVERGPITLNQVERIVSKSLARRH